MITLKSNKPAANTALPGAGQSSKILITGVDNSLARFLSYGLVEGGAQVSVQSVSNEAFLTLKPNFPVIQHSFADSQFSESLSTLAPDFILHASSEPVRELSGQTPIAAFNRIVEKTAVLCDVVRRCSPNSRIVLLSTTDVYGDCPSAKTESAPLDSVSLNGGNFAMAEQILQSFSECYNLKSTVLRIASAYGPAVRNNPIFDLLFKLIGPQGTSTNYAYDPSASRDIIHAADVLQAIKLILKNPTDAIYNVASGHSMTLGELNTHLCAILELPDTNCSGTEGKTEATHQRFDISKIAALGFIPQVPLVEGLRGYAAWWSGVKAA